MSKYSCSQYDMLNIAKLKDDKIAPYLCNMCGQYTTKDDSVSHRGCNLICNRCFYKLQYVLDDYYILDKIHAAGRKRLEEFEKESENGTTD